MRAVVVGMLGVLGVCGAACGGSGPPAQTGGATSPSSATLDSSPPASTAPEPAHSPEFAAGLKAFDAGSYPAARTAFDAASKKNPKDYEALWNLGQTCEKLGDNASAEAAYKAELAVNPDLEDPAAELSALYASDGHVDDAIAVAKAGLGRHPGSGALHTSLAVAMATRGDQGGATQEFDSAVQATPKNPMLQYTYAHWLNTWHTPGAAPHLDAAIAQVKDDYAMVVSIGHEYRMAGAFDGCTKTLDRAIGMKDGGEARTERALCKVGSKDTDGALADLQAAVQTEPSYAPAHYYLGGRLASVRRYKEAAAEYSKYLELAPSGSAAKQAAERLKLAKDAAVHDKGAVSPPK
jgi:tetratricopeptide (TPR) repeat protein